MIRMIRIARHSCFEGRHGVHNKDNKVKGWLLELTLLSRHVYFQFMHVIEAVAVCACEVAFLHNAKLIMLCLVSSMRMLSEESEWLSCVADKDGERSGRISCGLRQWAPSCNLHKLASDSSVRGRAVSGARNGSSCCGLAVWVRVHARVVVSGCRISVIQLFKLTTNFARATYVFTDA
jgi:hypothetical protein